ncbi:hypothetical protein L204_104614 [Cryptococcus depauperatus]
MWGSSSGGHAVSIRASDTVVGSVDGRGVLGSVDGFSVVTGSGCSREYIRTRLWSVVERGGSVAEVGFLIDLCAVALLSALYAGHSWMECGHVTLEHFG